jgi:hypothetical protein
VVKKTAKKADATEKKTEKKAAKVEKKTEDKAEKAEKVDTARIHHPDTTPTQSSPPRTLLLRMPPPPFSRLFSRPPQQCAELTVRVGGQAQDDEEEGGRCHQVMGTPTLIYIVLDCLYRAGGCIGR